MRLPTRLRTLCLALLLGALLALPATAAGAGKQDLQLHLAAANGYQIVVAGHGATAFLTVSRPHRAFGPRRSFSTYIARAKVGASRIEAGFGALGRVAMRFDPSGRVVRGRSGPHCMGRERPTTRFGAFVGVLRFRGEGGYTSALVHRARGKVAGRPSPGCESAAQEGAASAAGAGAAGKKPKITSMSAGWRAGLAATFFSARVDPAGKAYFDAEIEQSEGRLAIYRGAFIPASPLTFVSDGALSFASVSPPAPFGGTGLLQRNPAGSRDWTGSLAVSFPGMPNSPLTGPQFRTSLARTF